MKEPDFPLPDARTDIEGEINALYARLLDSWNRHSASDFAALFTADGNLVGFDGSPVDGRLQIERHLSAIFTDHITATYVGKSREVRLLSPDVALLRAVGGMTPPGQHVLNPALNVIQTIVAVRQRGEWQIAMYQNTPAQFHGRPDAVKALTQELSQLLG